MESTASLMAEVTAAFRMEDGCCSCSASHMPSAMAASRFTHVPALPTISVRAPSAAVCPLPSLLTQPQTSLPELSEMDDCRFPCQDTSPRESPSSQSPISSLPLLFDQREGVGGIGPPGVRGRLENDIDSHIDSLIEKHCNGEINMVEMLHSLHSQQQENQRHQDQILSLTAKRERLQLLNVECLRRKKTRKRKPKKVFEIDFNDDVNFETHLHCTNVHQARASSAASNSPQPEESGESQRDSPCNNTQPGAHSPGGGVEAELLCLTSPVDLLCGPVPSCLPSPQLHPDPVLLQQADLIRFEEQTPSPVPESDRTEEAADVVVVAPVVCDVAPQPTVARQPTNAVVTGVTKAPQPLTTLKMASMDSPRKRALRSKVKLAANFSFTAAP